MNLTDNNNQDQQWRTRTKGTKVSGLCNPSSCCWCGQHQGVSIVLVRLLPLTNISSPGGGRRVRSQSQGCWIPGKWGSEFWRGNSVVHQIVPWSYGFFVPGLTWKLLSWVFIEHVVEGLTLWPLQFLMDSWKLIFESHIFHWLGDT